MAEFKIVTKKIGKNGKMLARAMLGNELLHAQKLDVAIPDERERFAKATCKGRPGLKKAPILDELVRIAGDCVQDEESDGAERQTQSALLVALCEGVEFWHAADVPYATIIIQDGPADDVVSNPDAPPGGEHREHHRVLGKSFRLWISVQFYKQYGKAPGGQGLQDALGVLGGRALFAGPAYVPAVRLAETPDALYLDLANDKWEAVRITASGWEIVADPPVKFIRNSGMQALPYPARGGKLDELRKFVNAGDNAQWMMMAAWLVGAMRARGPYPILALNGEQGSAKSTTCRMLRRLIDPNDADLRSSPREERDLAIAAASSWIVGFDNLSFIQNDRKFAFSDAICRLATGGGFATRELYSDDRERIFNSTRPVMLNGIEEVATQPDLIERAIILTLPAIADGERKTEAELWADFELAAPRILGALLNAAAAALKNINAVKLPTLPRMADFATWIVAAESALGWPPGFFLSRYAENRDNAAELALESSAVGPAVVQLMEVNSSWQGTAAELLADLDAAAASRWASDPRPVRKDWPTTPKALSNSLRRVAPVLRKHGIAVNFTRESATRTRARLIVLERISVSGKPETDTMRQGVFA